MTQREALEQFNNLYNKYLEKERDAKIKGKHNYNIFNALCVNNKEVSHSKFLSSLLKVDRNDTHCQNDLFLSEFIKKCKLVDFELEIEKANVINENENRIDIYITDGKKHIIIENKIDACDQPQQLLRYIKHVYEKIKDNKTNLKQPQTILDKIYIIYLSPDGRPPKEEVSLQEEGYGFKINHDYLESTTGNKKYKILHRKWVESLGKVKVKFKCISYEKEILKWIEEIKSKNRIQKITDLKILIEHYEKVVKQIAGIEEKPKPINESLIRHLVKYYDIYFGLAQKNENIDENLKYAKMRIINRFFKNEVYEKLSRKISKTANWKISDYIPLDSSNYDYGNVIEIKPSRHGDKYIFYVLQINNGIEKLGFGAVRSDDVVTNIEEIINDDQKFKKLGLHGKKKNYTYPYRNESWAFFKFFNQDCDDFALCIVKNDRKALAQKIVDFVFNIINDLNDEMIKLNKTIKTLENPS